MKKGHTIYEDDLIICIVPDKPAAFGHVRLYPKKEYADIESMDSVTIEHIFSIANVISSSLFDITQAQGTNIIANNGKTKTEKGFFIDVIARKAQDGLDFFWKPKQGDQNVLNDVAVSIKDAILFKSSSKGKTQQKEEARPVIEKESYKAKQLYRRP